MLKRIGTGVLVTLSLISMLTLAWNIQPVESSGTIYIRTDGSIDPPTAPISSVDNITYTFTDNIYDKIVVERSSIIIDGAGYTLQGSGNEKGFEIANIHNVMIQSANVRGFSQGIYLYGSSNNTLSGNTITSNSDGIWLEDSSNNSISGNKIANNGHWGVWIHYSNSNSFFGNNITNNIDGISVGITLMMSSNNMLRNNSIAGNGCNFAVYDGALSYAVHDVDSSNTVDGKPIYYWVNRQNMAVPSDAGYVALVSSKNITVEGLELSNNGQGILLANTNNSRIADNNITNNRFYGVELVKSSHNTVFGNNMTSNYYGIESYHSSSNTISGNNMENNNYGMSFSWSSSSIIHGNHIATNNFYGILLWYSSNNKFYHNNFINNTQQVSQTESLNFWDDGYPSGGNYWSDYNGTDFYSGPQQNLTGSDGIGDTPYIIDENNTDRYPLMNPWASDVKTWRTSFIGLGGYPIVDFAVYNGKLYAAADNMLIMHDGSNWNVIDAPIYIISLEPYQDKLIVGGHSGVYSYDETTFNPIFSVPTYIKILGVYDNVLYAGTVLDKPPTLYYCSGSVTEPANWHIDSGFTDILNFSGPFGSIDSFTVYNNNVYVSSGGTVYCYSGTDWSVVNKYDDVYAFLDMKVYNGKLYLATRDQAWRNPIYLGYSGFSGRIMEFDGINWTTILDHDYWIYSLETYDGKLYVGTANKIYTYNGTDWEISFITFNNTIYAGMGNGYIFADPSFEMPAIDTVAVPEFPSTAILLLALMFTVLAVILGKKKLPKELARAHTNT